MADVSDKGAPAAIFMAVSRSLIRGAAIATNTPEAMLRQTNLTILKDTESGMFVTVYYVILEPGGKFVGVNAGHNRPLLYRAEQRTARIFAARRASAGLVRGPARKGDPLPA